MYVKSSFRSEICHPEFISGLPAIALATAGIHGLVAPITQLQKF